jgi:uncharacterized membrane protein
MDWLLLFHLLGAFLFFAGAAVAAVGQLEALRRRRPSEVALLLGTTRWGVALVGVGALMTIVFGSWLVTDDLRPWKFDQGWIEAAYILWVASMVVGAVGGRPARKTRELAQRLAAAGDEPNDELDRAVRDPLSLALSFLSGAIVVALIVDMVWKPGL